MVCDMEEDGLEGVPGQSEDEGPGLLGYSPIVARLDHLADRLLAIRTAVQANYTKDHVEPQWQPLPRPTTALDRERERRARTVLEEVDALILGGGLVVGGME